MGKTTNKRGTQAYTHTHTHTHTHKHTHTHTHTNTRYKGIEKAQDLTSYPFPMGYTTNKRGTQAYAHTHTHTHIHTQTHAIKEEKRHKLSPHIHLQWGTPQTSVAHSPWR